MGHAHGVALPLFAYQLRWMDDLSRLKIYNKSRQIGITFVETLDLVQRCMAARQKWYFLSISESRAAEAIEYGAMHCRAIGELRASVERGWMSFDGVKYKHCTIAFPNGSKIIGLPANARTARGCSGNLVLDEFAHHIDAAKIWEAAHAIAMWGYHIHVISTPNGQQGEYYRLWTNDRRHDPDDIADMLASGRTIGDGWSRHHTTIHAARDDGHPVSVDQQRQLAGTEDTWLQEYCCAFLDESLAWIPYSLLQSCTDSAATLVLDSTQPPAGPCYLGYDVGRKRDLSVGWLTERRSERLVTRAVMVLERAPFSQQRTALWDLAGRARRIHVDETGIGAQLAEETVERFGELRAKGVTFAGKTPAKLATQVRGKMERRELLVPDDEHVRRDFHSVRRVYTDAGRQSFEAERGKDGHADRFWACGLSVDAASEAWDGWKADDVQTAAKKPRFDRVPGRNWGSY